MKLAIMQPYFFPYIGYFQLINAVDKWVVFDIVQYMRHQWINRNRILHPKSGFQYIIVPARKHSREIFIKDIVIDNRQNWKNRIIAQLAHYKKKAPFFKETIDFLKECFFSEESNVRNLSKLNTIILKKVCNRLNIKFKHTICSDLNLQLGGITHPGDWALMISDQLGAKEYINPSGGREIFVPSKFEEKGIKLKFLTPKPISYKQKGHEFIPNLSIVDVMMWNSKKEIKTMLGEYELSEPF